MNFYTEYKIKNCSRFINKIWCLDNSTGHKTIEGLNILPNGCFNIALLIGHGAEVLLKDKSYDVDQGIYCCSQITKPVKLTLKENTQVILIQLHAWYFSYYDTIDYSNFIDDISKSTINNFLFNQHINLNSTSILQDTLEVVEKHHQNLENLHPNQNPIEYITHQIVKDKGNSKITDYINQMSFSDRWIQQRFKKSTGLTPKQFAKIIQLRDTVDQMAYDKEVNSFTSIGYKSGFNDQSHFIKNFRQYTDTTPSRFDPKNFVLSLKE